uniref:Uncharacterized protein n=1 Tax=Anguilla anguilla TaxID=7936 RepID=A0A0E9VP42_ANGAN
MVVLSRIYPLGYQHISTSHGICGTERTLRYRSYHFCYSVAGKLTRLRTFLNKFIC